MFVVSHTNSLPNQPKNKFIVTPQVSKPPQMSPPISFSQVNQNSKLKTVKTNTLNPPTYLFRKKIQFKLCRDISQPKDKRTKRQKDKKISKIKRNSNEAFITGRWNFDEHQRFVEAIIKYGNDWKEVQKCVRTRSSTQARSHAQKFFVKIKKAKILKFNIDLTKNSIKMLHDIMTEMPSEDYKKMIKALNSVAFEKKMHHTKKGKKHMVSHLNMQDSNNLILDNSVYEDVNFQSDPNQTDNINKIEYTPNARITRRMSIEMMEMANNNTSFLNRRYSITGRNRKSINSLDGFFNPFMDDNDQKYFIQNNIDDKEYMLSFNKTFINTKTSRSRKVSQDDDFLFNYVTKKQNF